MEKCKLGLITELDRVWWLQDAMGCRRASSNKVKHESRWEARRKPITQINLIVKLDNSDWTATCFLHAVKQFSNVVTGDIVSFAQNTRYAPHRMMDWCRFIVSLYHHLAKGRSIKLYKSFCNKIGKMENKFVRNRFTFILFPTPHFPWRFMFTKSNWNLMTLSTCTGFSLFFSAKYFYPQKW